jgi:hypothetical protein
MIVQIGDIIEIPTAKGIAYALYTHQYDKPPKYGSLLRVFDKIFEQRETRFEEMSALPIRFSIFFPLKAAITRKIFSVVGHIDVPLNLKQFPLFRTGSPDLYSKKIEQWWLWDGNTAWKIPSLTNEQRKLSIRGIWNDTMLRNKIESGWRPETDSR